MGLFSFAGVMANASRADKYLPSWPVLSWLPATSRTGQPVPSRPGLLEHAVRASAEMAVASRAAALPGASRAGQLPKLPNGRTLNPSKPASTFLRN